MNFPISRSTTGSLLLLLAASFTVSTIASAQSQTSSGSGAASLVLLQHLDHIDEAAREPAIIEHPDGTLFVAGYGKLSNEKDQTVPRLWKSADHGVTWSRVNVGSANDGALANSDVSLAVAPDGTIYFVSMQFDRKTLEGVHIVIGIGTDSGQPWRWKMLARQRYDDRPWVAVAPDGTAHVIWNDGSGVYHTSTHDRGLTWSDPQIVHPDAGSSALAVGPKGEVAVRLTPSSASGNKYTEGLDLIAVSSDGGNTWQEHPAPGQRDWAPMDTPGTTPRWVEPLAWDSRGDLYSLWTEFKGIWLARSADRGATWKTDKIADPDALSYYPEIAVRAPGELAATWFSGAGESLRWHACVVRLSLGEGEPTVLMSAPLQTASWARSDMPDHLLVRSSAGEYLQPLFLNDGTLAVVSPVVDPAANRYGFSFWRFRVQ